MPSLKPDKKRKQRDEDIIAPNTPKKQLKPVRSAAPFSTSVCIPTSIIWNCTNLMQVTMCVYEVARALCLYGVSEVVLLDVEQEEVKEQVLAPKRKKIVFGEDDDDKEVKEVKIKDEVLLVATLLQFFITPPYLVKSSFTKQRLKFFKYAYQLPKITSLPFMLQHHDLSHYKEGLSIAKKGKTKQKLTKYINVGASKALIIDQEIPTNVRVTVDTKLGKIVSPCELYGVGSKTQFGYLVRVLLNFPLLFTQSLVSYTKTIYCNAGEWFANQVLKNESVEISKSYEINDEDKVLLIIGEYARLELSFKENKKQNEDLASVESFKLMCDYELEIAKGCRLEDAVLIALTKIN